MIEDNAPLELSGFTIPIKILPDRKTWNWCEIGGFKFQTIQRKKKPHYIYTFCLRDRKVIKDCPVILCLGYKKCWSLNYPAKREGNWILCRFQYSDSFGYFNPQGVKHDN